MIKGIVFVKDIIGIVFNSHMSVSKQIGDFENRSGRIFVAVAVNYGMVKRRLPVIMKDGVPVIAGVNEG